MNKRRIDALAYADEIAQALKKGVFLTTKNGDKINSMVIRLGTHRADLGAQRVRGVHKGPPLYPGDAGRESRIHGQRARQRL